MQFDMKLASVLAWRFADLGDRRLCFIVNLGIDNQGYSVRPPFDKRADPRECAHRKFPQNHVLRQTKFFTARGAALFYFCLDVKF